MRTTSWVVLAAFLGGLGGCDEDLASPEDGMSVVDLGPQVDIRLDGKSPAVDQIVTEGTPAPDGEPPDAGPPDTADPDLATADAVGPDAGQPDAPLPDAPLPDAPLPDAPQTPSYCDVLYRVAGTFRTTNAPLIGQFTKVVGTNASLPPFNPARTTPFTPTTFPSGFVRLRFPNLGGAPAAGPVKLVEYFLPMEFSTSTLGTTVNSDVDHSAGMLHLSSTTPQVIGDPPTLSRGCAAVASGTLSGTTLSWSSCSAAPDGTTSWTFNKAQSSDPGCLHRMSSWGNVNCTSGFCGMVTGLGNQRETWDQMLNSFQFTGTNLATATFTMAEVQTPNTNNVRTYVSFTATSVVKIECDTAGPVVCNEQ